MLGTGGSRGLGLGVVKALVACGADVTVIARDRARLDKVKHLGVKVRPGDAINPVFMNQAVVAVKPTILILNADAIPVLAPIDEQTGTSSALFGTLTWRLDFLVFKRH